MRRADDSVAARKAPICLNGSSDETSWRAPGGDPRPRQRLPWHGECFHGASMAQRLGRVAYFAVFLALGVAYYEFLGPGPTPSEKPENIAWYRPAGLALTMDSAWLAPLQRIAAKVEQARHEGRFEVRGLIPLGLFALPPLVLTGIGFLLFGSGLARSAALTLGLTLSAFSYYGWLDPETWQDYSWRWPAVLLSTSAYVSVFALAPCLVGAARRRSRGLQALAAVGFVGSIYFLSTEVTGTNPELQWNLSPWPTLTLYGFLLVGLVLGVVHGAAGAGILVGGMAPTFARKALTAAIATGVAALLRPIPFAGSGAVDYAVLVLPAATLALAGGRRTSGASAAIPFLVSALLIVGSIELGRWQGEYFLAKSRNEVAPVVIAALERYQKDFGHYPDDLQNLVPDYLPAIPHARVGWIPAPDQDLMYTYLGESFLLEFPGVVWVQCAYSPAMVAAEGDEKERASATAGGEQEILAPAWSCESKPPQLW